MSLFGMKNFMTYLGKELSKKKCANTSYQWGEGGDCNITISLLLAGQIFLSVAKEKRCTYVKRFF